MPSAEQDIRDEDGEATEVEHAYLRDAGGNPSQALREVIRDALAERRHARLREAMQARLISHGYVRKSPVGSP